MKKYELQVFSKVATLSGVRRVRRIGENDEFESLRPYYQGDNIKSINWRATARSNKLIVNQFQNTRAQNVFCVIDKGRSMKMPFDDLTLLDYSINAGLVISNIILRKYDKVGLITFSEKMGVMISADNKPNQLELIAQKLYDQKTDFRDSNYRLLYTSIKRFVTRRSILLFFSNFEQMIDLERNIGYINSLSRQHLLVVIIFINTELVESSEMECNLKSDIYLKTFAQMSLFEKEKIKIKLESMGIQTILTKPKDLNINVINKYLEIKAKRMS